MEYCKDKHCTWICPRNPNPKYRKKEEVDVGSDVGKINL